MRDEKKFFPEIHPPHHLLPDAQYVKSIAGSRETLGLLSRRSPVKYPWYKQARPTSAHNNYTHIQINLTITFNVIVRFFLYTLSHTKHRLVRPGTQVAAVLCAITHPQQFYSTRGSHAHALITSCNLCKMTIDTAPALWYTVTIKRGRLYP